MAADVALYCSACQESILHRWIAPHWRCGACSAVYGCGSSATAGGVTVTADLAAYPHAWQLMRAVREAGELLRQAYEGGQWKAEAAR